MLKKFNSYMSYLIVYTVLLTILGLILIIYPQISMVTISYIISAGLIANGITLLFKNERSLFIDFVSIGTVSLVFGVITLINPNIITNLIPIIIGMWMTVSAIFKIRISLVLKECNKNVWLWTMLLSVLSLSCGIIMILNPTLGSITLTILIGILLIIYSIFTLIDIIIFKKNVNTISRNYKRLETNMRK